MSSGVSPSCALVDTIHTSPSKLPSFLFNCSTSDTVDHEAVVAAVIDNLSSLNCSVLWQLHARHIVRLEALMQACAPTVHSAAFTALAQHVLRETSVEGAAAATLTAAFTQSALSSFILALLRLSAQPASALPIFPLASSSSSTLLSALFFSSHSHSHLARQHILLLMMLVRPPRVQQQLVSSLLLQCLSCSPTPSSVALSGLSDSSAGSSPSAPASAASSLSPPNLSSVLSFLCDRVPLSTLLSAYSASLIAGATSPHSVLLSAHRTFLSRVLVSSSAASHSVGGCCPAARPLFDILSATVSSSVSHRQSGLLTLSLQASRHCIALLSDATTTNTSMTATAAASGVWRPPRDYSAWFDDQFSWVTAGERVSGRGDTGTARQKRRREKFVLRKKDESAMQCELDGDDDEHDDSDAEEARTDGKQLALARQQQKAEMERRRKERQHQREDEVQDEQRRRQREVEARADRQERLRFVVSCMHDSLPSDEPSVVTHYLHVVDRFWRGEGLLSEAKQMHTAGVHVSR